MKTLFLLSVLLLVLGRTAENPSVVDTSTALPGEPRTVCARMKVSGLRQDQQDIHFEECVTRFPNGTYIASTRM